jgi:hypothetical protein
LIDPGGAKWNPSRTASAPCMRGAHFHHTRAPLSHQMATLGVRRRSRGCVVFIFIMNVHHSHTKLRLWGCVRVRRCSGACAVLIFSFFGCPWLLLAAPSCSWLLLAAPGCSWLLLAAPGCPWLPLAAAGCSWLLLAAPGCCWLLLAPPGCSWLLLAAPGCSWLLLATSGCFWLQLTTTCSGSCAGIILRRVTEIASESCIALFGMYGDTQKAYDMTRSCHGCMEEEEEEEEEEGSTCCHHCRMDSGDSGWVIGSRVRHGHTNKTSKTYKQPDTRRSSSTRTISSCTGWHRMGFYGMACQQGLQL